jgi:hypothetical protein
MIVLKLVPRKPPVPVLLIILHNPFYSRFAFKPTQNHLQKLAIPTILATCLSLSNAVLLVAVPIKGFSLSVQLMKSQ